jgi:hypothetical protein
MGDSKSGAADRMKGQRKRPRRGLLDGGIGDGGIDLAVEQGDDFGSRVFGAQTPNHPMTSKPGTNSATVGNSGSTSLRVACHREGTSLAGSDVTDR